MNDKKIDVVVLWVDGNDPVWLAKKKKFTDSGESSNLDNTDERDCRYRDWGTLKYLLRGIYKNMPWVNRIFLITDRQRPEWLKETSKLRIIDHSDYIPKRYLPTFNSNTIELNLHRIKELSEHFIIFNDDMYAISPLKPTDFFLKGKPKDQAILKPIDPDCSNTDLYKSRALMLATINKNFSKKAAIRKNPLLWINFKYGKRLYSNIVLYPYTFFHGFYDSHIPISHLKSTFFEVWDKEEAVLDATCSCKIRNYSNNVSHWLFRYWNLASGKFMPRNDRIGKCFGFGNNESEEINKSIRKQSYKLICINDSDHGFNFELEKKKLIESFEAILPDKSPFEK